MNTLHALTALIPTDGPPGEVRLFRAGANDTEKGVFLFTERSATAVLAAAQRWGNEYSFDYEHQALQSPPVEAPAAGWFELETRDTPDGPELWATRIRWTPRALERIRDREYRYTSPAFLTDADDVIVELINVAITNLPATRALPALIAANHRRPFTGAAGAPKGDRMKNLMRKLGLQEDASEDAALEAVRTLTADREVIQRLAREVPDGADLIGTVLSWRDAARTVETLTSQVTDLEQQLNQRDAADRSRQVHELVTTGLADGKLTPASKDALLKALEDSTGSVDPARLRAYLDAAPRVVPTGATRTREPNQSTPSADGKTEWELLTNMQRHALAQTDRDEFNRILTEHRAQRAA